MKQLSILYRSMNSNDTDTDDVVPIIAPIDQYDWESLNTKYQIDWNNPIGAGAYGQVFEGYDGDTKVAIKMISLSDIKDQEREVSILKLMTSADGKCSVDGSICILGRYADDEDAYIVTPFIEGPHLYDLIDNIHKRRGDYSKRDVTKFVLGIMLDLAVKLQKIHNTGIAHMDISTSNIKINHTFQECMESKVKCNITYIDFGLGCVPNSNQKETHCDDSLDSLYSVDKTDAHYIENPQKYVQKYDIYRLGVMFFDLCFSRGYDSRYVLNRDYVDTGISVLDDVIIGMLQPSMNTRVSLETIIESLSRVSQDVTKELTFRDAQKI